MTKKYQSWGKEELISQLKKTENNKSYGLVWETQKEEIEINFNSKLSVLESVKEKEIKNGATDKQNIIIEGDNLHSLEVLCFTHKSKIDFIFIDPPYNTGNDTWKYNNKFVNDDDTFKHSKFCSFMYQRLQLAKQLLSPDGVLCLTIDNYEVHNVKHLLEEIFKDKEIIMTVTEHNYRGRSKNNFALTHEYSIWVVRKNKDVITKSSFLSEDIKRNLRRTGTDARREDVPTMFYGIEVDKNTLDILSVTDAVPQGENLPKSSNANSHIVFPVRPDGEEMRWYYGRDRVIKESKEGTVYAKKIKNKIEIHYLQKASPSRRKSVWRGTKFDSSTHGTELLTSIIGENDFPFPKSVYSVIESIQAATAKKDAIILDFFAGSGTTGHAVLELNRMDGGERKFILCTNNENKIAEKITWERIKNVINGYESKKNKKTQLFEQEITLSDIKNNKKLLSRVEEIKKLNPHYDSYEESLNFESYILWGIERGGKKIKGLGGNLKYFKIKLLDNSRTDGDKNFIAKELLETICFKEETYDPTKITKQFQIYSNKTKHTVIIYNNAFIEQAKSSIKELKGKVNIYVFSLSSDNYEDEFENITNIENIYPIPHPFLKIKERIIKNVSS